MRRYKRMQCAMGDINFPGFNWLEGGIQDGASKSKCDFFI